MRRSHLRRSYLKTCALWLCLVAPSIAQADILTLWAGAKADYVGGSGDVYQNFESTFGFGVEGGIEVVGIDLWMEALIMGQDQYLFSGNLGIDFAIGGKTRVTAGAFTGPILLLFPKGPVKTLALNSVERDLLVAAGLSDGDIDRAEVRYNDLADDEADLSRVAFGWNLVRAQLQVEFELAPFMYFGVGGEAGYHLMLSGEDAAAGAKNKVIDDVVAKENLAQEAENILRDAVGAKEVDPEKLNGLNYQVGAFFKFEL